MNTQRIVFALALAGALAAPLAGAAAATRAVTRPPTEPERAAPAPDAASVFATGGPVEVHGPVPVQLKDVPTGDPKARPGVLRAHAQGDMDDDDRPGEQGLAFERTEPLEEGPVPTPARSGDHPGEPDAPGDILRNFVGQQASGWIPPDPVLAVGPKYIVEVLNSGFTVFSKDGGLDRTYTDLENFFSPLYPFLPVPWSVNAFVFDPRVIYDPASGKFVIYALARDDNNLRSYAFIAISSTSNPLGGWGLYYYFDPYNLGNWIDYAGMSADSFGLYFTGNEFAFGGGYQFSIIFSIRPTILTGGDGSGWIFWGLTWNEGGNPLARTIQPAVAHTVAGDGGTFFVNTMNFSPYNHANIWEMTGDRGNAPTLVRNSATVNAYASPGLAHQPDPGADDIEDFYAGALTAAYSNRKLYFSLNNNATSASTFYVSKVDVDTRNQDSVIDYFTGGNYYYYPAVGLVGTDFVTPLVGVTMTWSSDSTYPTGAFKLYTNFTTDASGPFWITGGGSGTYNVYYQGRNRWGDYMGIARDWTCNTLWGVTEYTSATDTWSTAITELASDAALPQPCRLIFDDGFERGSAFNWSSYVP